MRRRRRLLLTGVQGTTITVSPSRLVARSTSSMLTTVRNSIVVTSNTHTHTRIYRYESWFNLTSDDTFEVVGKNSNTGKSTSLKCPRQGRKFNWADVTLEIYAIDSCTEFAKGPMLFDNVKLWDVNMSPIKPKWLLTSPNKPCKGKITLNTNGSLAVEHSTTA